MGPQQYDPQMSKRRKIYKHRVYTNSGVGSHLMKDMTPKAWLYTLGQEKIKTHPATYHPIS